MLRAYIKFSTGRVAFADSAAGLNEAMRDPDAVFWLDISDPTDDDYSILDEVFGFHPLAIEDTMGYSQRPKIESYNHIGDANKHGYFYMVIHGPDLNQFKENLRTKELDLFVSRNYLVTIHEEGIRPIENLHARAKVDARVVLEIGRAHV